MDDRSPQLTESSLLNQLWRLLMTGCCFVLFGLGGLLLSLVWFNLLQLQRDRLKRRRQARRSIAACFRFFLRCARAAGVLDYRIEGREILQRERGCLLVANHPTLIDYVLLASVMPEADCIVKAALQRNPFLRGVVRSADYLINREAEALLADCRQRLGDGDVILIFPEGTRSRHGEPLLLQRGAANIAVRCDADLRVVHIHCSQQTLGKQNRWYHIPPVKPCFSVVVRERISSRQFISEQECPAPLAARRLNRFLQHALTPRPL